MVEKHLLNITILDVNNVPEKIVKEYINKISTLHYQRVNNFTVYA